MSAWGYGIGHLVTKEAVLDNRTRGTAWIVFGMVGLSVMWSALSRGPALRGEPSPLETGFLDALPIREGSRLVVGLVERLFVYGLGAFALVGAFPQTPIRAVILSMVMSTAGVLVGEAMMRLARVVVPAMAIARARTYLLVIGQGVFLLCVVQAPALARASRFGLIVAGWPTHVVHAVARGGARYFLVLAIVLCVSGLAVGAITLAERFGYDKVDLVPTKRPKRTKGDDLVIERIDDVLRKREPGGRWATVVMTLYTTALTALFIGLSWKRTPIPIEDARSLVMGGCGLASFVSFVLVSQRAARMATRDVAARPLLAPLPIEPRALLEGKVKRLRRGALIVVCPLLAMLATPWPLAMHVEMVWRFAAVIIAAMVSAHAAASIAFLTVGAGNRKGPGGSFVVESILVLVPLVGVATAPYAWSVIVPLVALALVAREAHRSGLGCVRWLDDADDFERETPIWRALLVLGAFQSAQALSGRMVGLSELDTGTKTAIAYAASSAVLVALTLHARRDAPSMRAVPTNRLWVVVGAAAGLMTGALGLVYLRVLRFLQVELPEKGEGVSAIAIAVMAIGLAPIAEEIFFRGWLLPCIEDEVGASRRSWWLTPLISAFAFAAVHPPISFLPVFSLGLATSVLFLRSRALLPTIAAHFVHNAVAILVASAL